MSEAGDRMAQRSRSTTARGYGSKHKAMREAWRVRMVDEGEIVECHARVCFMTSRVIDPLEPWDLGHTIDRTEWTGPEHRYCNRKEPQLRERAAARARRRWVL